MTAAGTNTAMHPHVGDIIEGKKGKFRVTDLLSTEGRYARIYRVLALRSPDAVYAAKFFGVRDIRIFEGANPLEGTDDQRAFKRFTKEPKFLRLFNHPHIVALIDEYREFDSQSVRSEECFYVMEYLHGQSLRNASARFSSPSDVLKIAQAMASALAHIHGRGVVHRDIHPGNIYVSKRVPKLIDFGCAVGGGVTRPFEHPRPYNSIGGVFHRAPEMVAPEDASPACDIFSLGITLLELATNDLAKGGWPPLTTDQWIARALGSPMLRHFPRDFRQLITQMIAPNPEQRPTAQKVFHRLQERRSEGILVGIGIAAGLFLGTYSWFASTKETKHSGNARTADISPDHKASNTRPPQE